MARKKTTTNTPGGLIKAAAVGILRAQNVKALDMMVEAAGKTNIETIEKKLTRATKQSPVEATKWLWSVAGSKLRRADVPEEAFKPRHRDNVFIGGMFIYQYDPKHKDTLPWYDTLPVVIPIEIYDDGWLGLNLHYLRPDLRAKLLDKLMEFRRRSLTRKAYMNVSYRMLKAVAQHDLFQPCVHRYLATHVRTRLIRIDDQYWETVAMLPLQKFVKQSAAQVWRRTNPKTKRKRKK